MKTSEKILNELSLKFSPHIDIHNNIGGVDHLLWEQRSIECAKIAMEYGKQQYNQAIKDAAENAKYKSEYIGGGFSKNVVDKDSILKLLKQ